MVKRNRKKAKKATLGINTEVEMNPDVKMSPDAIETKNQRLFKKLLLLGNTSEIEGKNTLLIADLFNILSEFQTIDDIDSFDEYLRNQNEKLIVIAPIFTSLFFNFNPTPLNETIFPSSNKQIRSKLLISTASDSNFMTGKRRVYPITSRIPIANDDRTGSFPLSPAIIDDHMTTIQKGISTGISQIIENTSTIREKVDFSKRIIKSVLHHLRLLIDWRKFSQKRLQCSKPSSEKCLDSNISHLIYCISSFTNFLADLLENSDEIGEVSSFLKNFKDFNCTNDFPYELFKKTWQNQTEFQNWHIRPSNVDCDLSFNSAFMNKKFSFAGAELKALTHLKYKTYNDLETAGAEDRPLFGNMFTSFELSQTSPGILNFDSFKSAEPQSKLFRQSLAYMSRFRFKYFYLADGSTISFMVADKNTTRKLFINSETGFFNEPITLEKIQKQFLRSTNEFVAHHGDIGDFHDLKQIFDSVVDNNELNENSSTLKFYNEYKAYCIGQLKLFEKPIDDNLTTSSFYQLKEVIFTELLKATSTDLKISITALTALNPLRNLYENNILFLPLHELVFQNNNSYTSDGTLIPMQSAIFYFNYLINTCENKYFRNLDQNPAALEELSFSRDLDYLLNSKRKKFKDYLSIIRTKKVIQDNSGSGSKGNKDENSKKDEHGTGPEGQDKGDQSKGGRDNEDNDFDEEHYDAKNPKSTYEESLNETLEPTEYSSAPSSASSDDAVSPAQLSHEFTSESPLIGESAFYEYGKLSIPCLGRDLHKDPSFLRVYDIQTENLMKVFPPLQKILQENPEVKLGDNLIVKVFDPIIIEEWYLEYEPEILEDEPYVIEDKVNLYDTEIDCYKRINYHNKKCVKEEDKINVPKIYFYGSYKFRDSINMSSESDHPMYKGKIIIMEKLELDIFQYDMLPQLLEFGLTKIYNRLIEKGFKTLEKVNEVGIIHGDVSPSNFLFSHKKLYIIDFSMSTLNDGTYYELWSDTQTENERFKYFAAQLHYRLRPEHRV